MDKIPWHMQRTNVGSNPFKSFGDDWCPLCKTGVDTEGEGHCRGEEFVYRKRCNRCGSLIAWGVYKIGMLGGNKPSGTAYDWVKEPGEDRT